MRTFRLYPVEARWWSMSDYGNVLDATRELGARTVLEFGPGSSTLALIEGGAARIDCCEDDPHWSRTHRERLQKRFPDIVTIHDYAWTDPVSVPAIDGKRYDMALIDGPRETPRRPAVLAYCLARCDLVLVPLECAQGSRLMREACQAAATAAGRTLTTWQTGPDAGGFALIGSPC